VNLARPAVEDGFIRKKLLLCVEMDIIGHTENRKQKTENRSQKNPASCSLNYKA